MITGDPAPWRLSDFHVFGCPVFVLDKRLQDGDSLPKWKARCRSGVYVGHSLQHAGNVPLVYNPATTHVSPQYHVTFDDRFTTVRGTTVTLPDSVIAGLYDSLDWLFSKSYVSVDDMHLFETFWTEPPASRPRSASSPAFRSPLRRPPKPTDISGKYPDCPPPAVLASSPLVHDPVASSEHASNPACDHAAIHNNAASSKHASNPACDHAASSDHAALNGLAIPNRAPHNISVVDPESNCDPVRCTAADVSLDPTSSSSGESAPDASGPQSTVPYINICPVACSTT